MKNNMRKILSLFLSVVFVISAILCTPVTASDEAKGTDIPLIYVVGQGVPLYIYHENGDVERVYPVAIPDGFIESAVKENIGVFAKAVITQEWAEFGDVLHDIFTELYGQLALDDDLNTKNGIRNSYFWKDVYIDSATVNGKYPTEAFTFMYDFRLDPYKIADDLHGYIERVMAVTGSDHVALFGRCLGGCITAAYMEKYDGEYVSDLISYCSAINGATVCSKLFAGDIYLDADGIERFLYDTQLPVDEMSDELLKAFITLFNKTYGLDLACWAVNNVWDNLYLDTLAKVLVDTFATWPGYWAMVGDEDYQRAKDTVFHNADMTQKAKLIETIDNYHYNVQVKAPENFRKYAERGIDVYNVCKYGFQTIPVNAPSDMLSDNTCGLTESSMGAVTTSIFTTFDNDYLAAAKQNGAEKYIAPDRQVDASTCLFPERTWFVKNLEHKDFPENINRLFDLMVNRDGFDIHSDSSMPQFIVYRDGQLVPMTVDNCDTTTAKYTHTLGEALKVIIKHLTRIISDFIKSKVAVA